MIYTVTLNPALDKTVEIPGMALDTVNRITEMRTDPGGKGINVSKVIAKLGGDSRAVGILVVRAAERSKSCSKTRISPRSSGSLRGRPARISKSLTGSATRIPTSTSRV